MYPMMLMRCFCLPQLHGLSVYTTTTRNLLGHTIIVQTEPPRHDGYIAWPQYDIGGKCLSQEHNNALPCLGTELRSEILQLQLAILSSELSEL